MRTRQMKTGEQRPSDEKEEEFIFNQDIHGLENLPESAALFSNTEITRAQEIMGEAVEHLQGRQREAYFLVMRDSKSYQEAAEILDVSKSAVQIYVNRAKKFITGYCRTVAKKEGLL